MDVQKVGCESTLKQVPKQAQEEKVKIAQGQNALPSSHSSWGSAIRDL